MKAVCMCLAVLGAAQAQPFDVASVKRTPPGTREFLLGAQHGTLTGRNTPLTHYIAFAYGVLPAQVSGAPPWAAGETFDIVAKSAPNVPDAQVRRMLQWLLAERFGLRVHESAQEMPVYVLTVAKGGPTLRVSKAPEAAWQIGRGSLRGEGVSLPDVAEALSGRLDRKVVDRTGIAGSYDLELQWTPEAAPPPVNPEEAPPNPNVPSIFSAIQEQLGLRLEGSRAPVDLIVIDHLDHAFVGN